MEELKSGMVTLLWYQLWEEHPLGTHFCSAEPPEVLEKLDP